MGPVSLLPVVDLSHRVRADVLTVAYVREARTGNLHIRLDHSQELAAVHQASDRLRQELDELRTETQPAVDLSTRIRADVLTAAYVRQIRASGFNPQETVAHD